MGSLDEETKRLLMELWLPRVRELRDQRKPVFFVMLFIMLVPMFAAIAMLAQQYFLIQKLDLGQSGLSALLLGVSALAFVYLGRLQQCNDVIVAIEFTVILGDREQIIKCIGNISCFGKMQDLLRDIGPLLKAKVQHDDH